MKAVNLIPRDAQRSFGTVRSLGAGTTALFAVLSMAVVMVAAYVLLANSVTDKRGELAQVKTQQVAAEQQVAKLKRYDDLEKARVALLERVRTLAAGRYDWPTALGRLSRAMPADSALTGLTGSAGDGEAGPSFKLNGCTDSHNRVAALIDRLRSVQGVMGVALQSSKVADTASTECGHPEEFELTIQLKAPEAAAPAATAGAAPGAAAAPAAATPTPTTASTGGTQ